MKTVKQLTTLFFVLIVSNSFGQYLETFSIQDRGVLPGTCSGSEASCITDYTGVDWRITGDFSGMDGNDFFRTSSTSAGRLHGDGDVDATIAPGICFETPTLDISAVAGAASLSLSLNWVSWDVQDIANVEYQLDGGSWVQLPPLSGTDGPGTVDFNSDGNTGTGVASAGGLIGNTLTIRVCLLNTNSFGDDIFIDDVSVPEAGAMILPVKWAEFNVKPLNEGNQLNWATYTEVNNEEFEIEKSNDNMLNFRKIGTVKGVGNSTKLSRYDFLDTEITSATSYYRIKQVDFDGNFEYSEILVVQNNLKNNIRFTPNPFTSQILISADKQDLTEGTTIRMYNNQGQIVVEKMITERNLNDPIDTAHLNAGMYSVQFANGEIVRLVKF